MNRWAQSCVMISWGLPMALRRLQLYHGGLGIQSSIYTKKYSTDSNHYSTYTYICNIPTFCVVTEPFVYTKQFCGIWYVHRKTGRGTGATGVKKWTISSQRIHRVDRVLGFFSSRRYWDSPPPSPQASVPPPFWFQGEGHTRLRERVWGRGLQCFNLNGNQTENDRYWQKNNFLLFAKCLKMYSFFRICI